MIALELPKDCIYHILMWNWRDDATEETRADLQAQLLALPGKLPMLRGVRQGPVVGGRNQSFTHCFVMVFSSMEDLAAYSAHPDHMSFAVPFREACAVQVVVDMQA